MHSLNRRSSNSDNFPGEAKSRGGAGIGRLPRMLYQMNSKYITRCTARRPVIILHNALQSGQLLSYTMHYKVASYYLTQCTTKWSVTILHNALLSGQLLSYTMH